MTLKVSIKQLQAVETVARLGSFTLAAKDLGVSQPTISNLVYSLEKQFRCRLLDRSGPNVTPSEALEEIRGTIRAILSQTDVVERHLSNGRALQHGRFQIGYTTHQIAMPVISEFIQKFPSIDVNARAMATYDLLPLLEKGVFDVGFVTYNQLPAGFDGIAVAPARIGLVVKNDHPLAAQKTIPWKSVSGLRLIQRETSSGTRRIFESAAQLAKVQPHTALGLGSWGSITSMVRSGVGVGVGFERECRDEQGLSFVGIDDRNLMATHYLACHPAMRDTAHVATLFEIAEAYAS